ncbi:MBL fold metallo-hydrolase [Flavobacterium pallidum]|uniref:MBL fold metallo-hydrolase n=1 Tax=Flavobacterium pallidum TaxID=2172098 RepID=A0A2S1SIC3_9FLAO|nr:MBL fold metallo-hydrolase [Flavobacterium pallidum]AWI26163.1 MBL fold metallo-hydrolase [Flavobacterium pallidum]
MLVSGSLLIIVIIAAYLFLQHPKFGKLPSGERLGQIKKSPNYRDGKFQNLSFTPDLAEGETFFKVLKKVLFEKDKRNKPTTILPSIKTDLHALAADENVLIWFGHSSYFMQLEGRKILVDPVFSGAASPIPATTRSFKGADVYDTEDIPEIDYLFISHDHWDHLDHETVVKLKPKIKTIITGLGTGAHLEHWGYNPKIIIEKDWNETIVLPDDFTVHTVPGRHFAGRLFKRNQALWTSFVLQTPKRKIFIGGDSGYDTHFSKIGEDFGPFDLAILECGQYNKSWKNIHLMPGEIVPAAQFLKAKALLPVHWAKFALALHAWDEPITLAVADAKAANLPLLTPMIGEKMDLDAPKTSQEWWKKVN